MLRILLLTLVAITFSLPLMGKTCYTKCNKVRPKCGKKKKCDTKSNYYLMLGGGSSEIKYAADTLPASRLDDPDMDLDRSSFFLDAAVYLPFSKQLLLGGAISADVDIFDNIDTYSWDEERSEVWTTLTFTASALYFFNQIHDGFFLRGDFGLSHAYYVNDDEDFQETKEDQQGFAARIGGGYALKMGKDWSLLFAGAVSAKRIDGELVGASNLFVSILF